MTREEAIGILKPFMAYMYDQNGCPISDVAIALDVAISALEQPEIIHCRECKYSHMTYDGECKYCDIWFPGEKWYLDGDYFCASAEKREEGGAG